MVYKGDWSGIGKEHIAGPTKPPDLSPVVGTVFDGVVYDKERFQRHTASLG